MRRSLGPSSWISQLLGLAFMVLLAALALHWAVDLLMDIWLPLAGLVCLAVCIAGLIAFVRYRNRSW